MGINILKIISHRGNLQGPKTCDENSLDAIHNAIKNDFDVEIDLRYVDGNFFLGHDEASYKISIDQLIPIKDRLWIHCKNFAALDELCGSDFNYFFHHSDDHTLTSRGYIWTFPGKDLGKNNILVMPEYAMPLNDVFKLAAWGICSDYVLAIREWHLPNQQYGV
jgi:hypothetical protein